MHSISIEKTNNPDILKFKINNTLLKIKDSIEVSRSTDLIDYPMLQNIMEFPFILGLYVTPDFIAVHKEKSITWDLVQEALSDRITDLLDDGVPIVREKQNKVHTTIYIESTPNENVYKFIANRVLTEGQYEFFRGDDTSNVPLATFLFENTALQNIFLKDNYVALTKNTDISWYEIQMPIRESIQQYLQKGNPVILDDTPQRHLSGKSKNQTSNKSFSPVEQQIVNVLEEYIEPAVSADGGHIEFESYNPDSKEVIVGLRGACNGCPSSAMTLKNAVEQTLKNVIGETLIGDVVAR